MCRLLEGAVQEDAGRVEAERRRQSLPEADQTLLLAGWPIARLHRAGAPILSMAGYYLTGGGQEHHLDHTGGMCHGYERMVGPG